MAKASLPNSQSKTKTCSFIGCDRPYSTKGFCSRHYYSENPLIRTRACWVNAIERCHNPRHAAFKDYGGRGISVCNRWRYSFENFLADMGEQPKGLTIERVDNDGNYCPENCKWANQGDQNRNQRRVRGPLLTWQGRSLTLPDWAREIGVHRTTLRDRWRRGLPPSEILSPARPGLRLTINGITQSVFYWAKVVTIRPQSIRLRLEQGWCAMCAVFLLPKSGDYCRHIEEQL